MTTTRKKLPIAAILICAVALLAATRYGLKAEKKNTTKKTGIVKTIEAAKQMAALPENNNTELTVKGIYAGGGTKTTIILKSPAEENKAPILLYCSFAGGGIGEISDIPPMSEFVVTGTITQQNHTAVLINCRLISINLPVDTN